MVASLCQGGNLRPLWTYFEDKGKENRKKLDIRLIWRKKAGRAFFRVQVQGLEKALR